MFGLDRKITYGPFRKFAETVPHYEERADASGSSLPSLICRKPESRRTCDGMRWSHRFFRGDPLAGRARARWIVGHVHPMKAWLFRFHRWLALAFALPLAVVLVTGLILSFEPWLANRAIQPGSLTPAKIEMLLQRHDPNGQARAIAYRSYDNTLTIGARGQGKIVDAASGDLRPGPSGLAATLVTARRLHETLLLDAGWLVFASTVAMLALVILGALMGWPRIRNTLAGWHKAMGWGLLPLPCSRR